VADEQAFGHAVRYATRMTDELDELQQVGRRFQRLRTEAEALRPTVAEKIRAAAQAGVAQVEIVKATGYTRDQVRKIAKGKTR
jgi:hypothetical protein